ncbi:MAG: NHL repeat-containing protein [Thermomicrobiales bacterium]
MSTSPLFRGFTAPLTRRALAAALAMLPLTSATAKKQHKAKRKKRVQPEHNVHGHKATMCVNGVTKHVAKHARQKYLKHGATRGACAGPGPGPDPTCTPDSAATTCAAAGICGDVTNNCGDPVTCGCPGSQLCCGSACAAALTWANQTTFGDSDFNVPTSVALAPDTLTAWIADAGNNRISIWSRPTATSTAWSNQTTFGSSGSGASNLSSPSGVAISKDTLTAFIADTGNTRVSVWRRPDTASTTWSNAATFGSSGAGASQFSNPQRVAVSPDTLTVWIADSGNSRMSVWTRPDTASTTWANQTTFGTNGAGASQFRAPYGVTISADTLTTVVADTYNYRISLWTRPDTASTAWSNLTTFGTNGTGASQFKAPFGAAISEDTLTIVVADTNNYRGSIWTRPDTASTAWSNLTTFSSSGSGPNELAYPNGLAITPDALTVWIADTSNNRISIWAAICPA